MAEAGRLARLLIYLLERADAPTEGARSVLDAVTRRERTQWLRADGHIEPRKRFKGGPLVRVRDPERHFLFIDESGKSLPGGSPYFALGAVALTGAEVDRYRRRANEIKQRFFGRRELTFHEPAMRRRIGDFSFGDDPARQLAFDRAFRRLVRGTDFVAFGVGIRKGPFAAFDHVPSECPAAGVPRVARVAFRHPVDPSNVTVVFSESMLPETKAGWTGRGGPSQVQPPARMPLGTR